MGGKAIGPGGGILSSGGAGFGVYTTAVVGFALVQQVAFLATSFFNPENKAPLPISSNSANNAGSSTIGEKLFRYGFSYAWASVPQSAKDSLRKAGYAATGALVLYGAYKLGRGSSASGRVVVSNTTPVNVHFHFPEGVTKKEIDPEKITVISS